MVWRVFYHTVHMAREVSGRDDMRFALCGEDDTIHFLREYIMNLYDLDSDKITMNIDGKDMEMKPAICYDRVIDKWLVSRCGKVWSSGQGFNKLISGRKKYSYRKGNKRKLRGIEIHLKTPIGFWEDGSGAYHGSWGKQVGREITVHKIVMDTWAPLYDNPPEGITWEEWEIARDLPTVYDHISKTIVIDHIDDDPTNNHLDNLRRTTSWDNNSVRKAKGI